MENPATWSADAKRIAAAIERWEDQQRQGIIGGSLVAIIEDDVVKPLRQQKCPCCGYAAEQSH
jgi:hypothetical protein